MAIEISVNEQGKKRKKENPFQNKKCRLVHIGKNSGYQSKNFQDSFQTIINPDIIDAQTSALTNIIIDSAADFFGNTETSKQNSKGWWSTDI